MDVLVEPKVVRSKGMILFENFVLRLEMFKLGPRFPLIVQKFWLKSESKWLFHEFLNSSIRSIYVMVISFQ